MEHQKNKRLNLQKFHLWLENSRWPWFLPLFFAIIPIVMAARFTCPVPRADHWFVITNPYINHANGGSWWNFIHSPGSDSRHDVPKLLHYLIIKLTHWNLGVESVTCVFIAIIACAIVLQLWRKHPGSPLKNWLLGCLSMMLILSPMQWMNWTWGIQICYAMVVTATVGVVAVFHTKWSPLQKSLLGALCASAAAMSYINGWAAWMIGSVLLIVACAKHQWRPKEILPAIAVWLMALVVTLWWFLIDWPENMSDNDISLLQRALLHPLQDLYFFLQLLGAPFAECWLVPDRAGRNSIQIAASPWIGAFTLFLFTCVIIHFWRQRHVVSWKNASPWICLLLWGLANAAAIGLARTDNGLSSPFQSRYPSFVLWYHLGLLGLLFMINGGIAISLRHVYIAIILWGGSIGAVQGWRDATRDSMQNQFISAATALRHAAIEPVYLDEVIPGGGAAIIPSLDQLDKLGLLNVSTIKSDLVSQSHIITKHSYDGLLKEGKAEGNGVFLKGWAVNRDTRDAVDVVVISYAADGEPERWFGIATHKIRETKLSTKMKVRAFEDRIGWAYQPLTGKETCAFSDKPLDLFRKPLPKGNITFRAYVFDVIKGIFYPLAGSVVINRG